MAKATSCLIGVDLALQLRDERGSQFAKATFRCMGCGRPVKPMAKSDSGVAHFEHYERNIDCKYSDKRPIRKAYADATRAKAQGAG